MVWAGTEARQSASGTLWGENAGVAPEKLSGQGNVWFVGDTSEAPNDFSAFAEAGCSEIETRAYQRMHIVAFACP